MNKVVFKNSGYYMEISVDGFIETRRCYMRISDGSRKYYPEINHREKLIETLSGNMEIIYV